jgi:excisionase family DNA binding protein
MIIGETGPAVVISARTAAWLEKYAGLTSLRVRVRGTDPEISRHLEEIRLAAMSWRSAAIGTGVVTKPEPESLWLSTTEAAEHVGLTPRGIRTAIAANRLDAAKVGHCWRIALEDLEHYCAAKAAA